MKDFLCLTTKIIYSGLFFVRFEGNSILSKKLKLGFFPLKLDFFTGNWIYREFCTNLIAEKSFLSNHFDGVTLFMPRNYH